MGSTAASFSGRLFGQPAGRLPPGIGPADPRRVQTTRRLAIGLAAVALAGAAPALSDIDLAAAPGWARAALLLATVQAAYVAWLLAVPDWSSLRVLMIVFGAAAAIYGGAALAVLFAPAGRPLPLDLEPLRRLAAQWCMVMLLLNGSLAGLCGAAAARWRAGK
jgi:hypothetical protein